MTALTPFKFLGAVFWISFPAAASVTPCSWGGNGNGALGNGLLANSSVPVAVVANGVLAGEQVTAVSAGNQFSLALTSLGKVRSWGISSCLGAGGVPSSSVPVMVDSSGVLSGKTVTAISAGYGHALALTSEGKVCAWGTNSWGALGTGLPDPSDVPVEVYTGGVLAGKTVTAIAAGGDYSLALTADHQLFAWGANGGGVLGNGGNGFSTSPVPVAVTMGGVLAGKTITAISAGTYHCLALSQDGEVFSWGTGSWGALGNGSLANANYPVAVHMTGALAGKVVTAVAAGSHHSLALTTEGKVYAWGDNGAGELGDGSFTTRTEPVVVDMNGAIAGRIVTAISAGMDFSVASTADGRVFAWGYAPGGQLGNGTFNPNSNVPVAVHSSGAIAGRRVTGVSAGHSHALALATNDPFPAHTYAEFRKAYFAPSSWPFAGNSGADPDGDGLTNLLEYALARDPGLPDGASPTMAKDEGSHLTLTYVRSRTATDLSFTVEVGGLAGNWQSGTGATETVALDPLDALRERVVVQDVAPKSSHPKRFMRLRVENN